MDIGGETLCVISYPTTAPDLRAAGSLTAAEIAVAELAIAGLTNAEIARRRRTSPRTVANQMAALLRKLGCGSRRELAVRYVRNDLPNRAAERSRSDRGVTAK